MAQHDYDIANQSGANFRADLNNALDAIVSNNSGSSQPSTTFAYEWWIDTSNNLLKLRNSANNAWITLPLSITADNATSGGLTVNGNLATTGTVDINGQELILDADADTSITADTDDQIDFKIGGTDVATLTNSHLVLKGTTPKITIGDGGEEDTVLIFDGNAQDFYIGLDDSADDLFIGTGSTVGTNGLVVIENGGNVGIGETVPLGKLHIKNGDSGASSVSGDKDELVIENNSHAGITTLATDSTESGMFFGHTSDTRAGEIFTRLDTTTMTIGTRMTGGIVVFLSDNGTESMRITSDGYLLLGSTATTRSDTGIKMDGDGNTPYIDNVMNTSSNIDSTFHFININATNNGERFYVRANGGVVNYSANNVNLSDERKKTNIELSGNYLEKICNIPIKLFNYKDQPENTARSLGVIAQDVESIAPELVSNDGFGDTPEDGVPLKTVYTTDMMYALMKAMQEQQDIIVDLKSRIETLEG